MLLIKPMIVIRLLLWGSNCQSSQRSMYPTTGLFVIPFSSIAETRQQLYHREPEPPTPPEIGAANSVVHRRIEPGVLFFAVGGLRFGHGVLPQVRSSTSICGVPPACLIISI